MPAAPPGQEQCPHCRRPFKRLRSHLPHCKAAPSRAPGPAGSTDRAGPGAAAKSGGSPPSPSEGKGLPGGGKAAAGQGGGPVPGAERAAEAAVREGARSLGLPPAEVKDVPGTLGSGAEIVIEKHRARVVRAKSGAGAGGASAGAAAPGPGPQEAVTGARRTQAETRGPGAAGKAPAGSERGKGSLKATKPPVRGAAPGASGSSGAGDLVLQGGTGKTAVEEKRGHPEAGVGQKAPAPHSENLHLPATEAPGEHSEGTSKTYLTSTHELSESKQQMVSEPILSARRDAELALHQPVLHASQSHPICLPQAPGRSTQAGTLGLEWFPDLYPNYDRLRIFPGKPFHEDVGITMRTPMGNFSKGQQGPLLDRQLMDVRLGELPLWVTTRDFSPQALLGGAQRAWNSYYNKYINVKKGGPAGVSMLLAGYCLLSYAWNYQHIKRYRWRKYH
ncbi:mitochondrial nucleoid-associated protein 1 isoform X1 [Lathamus discolor]|uniref:mitochondrial nucleoid-associated protein 1 isoform X1 n=1 Tax=Lathamus discolor TaxID=678569 RepID=UPI0032B81CC6